VESSKFVAKTPPVISLKRIVLFLSFIGFKKNKVSNKGWKKGGGKLHSFEMDIVKRFMKSINTSCVCAYGLRKKCYCRDKKIYFEIFHFFYEQSYHFTPITLAFEIFLSDSTSYCSKKKNRKMYISLAAFSVSGLKAAFCRYSMPKITK
jgi:hypothetical protein